MSHRVGCLAIAVVLVAGCATGNGPSTSVAPTSVPATAPPLMATSTRPPATADPTATQMPTLRPGEAWIAFQTNSQAGYGVHLIRPDGTGLHRWPSGIAGTHEHPSWSSDGERILLNTVDPDGTEDLWIGNADGTGTQRIVDCVDPCLWADEPAWSPDARIVAFSRATLEDGKLRSGLELLDLATGEITVAATMPDGEVVLAPRWSPDGRRLVIEMIRLAEPTLASLESVGPVGGAIGMLDLEAATPTVELLTDADEFAQSPDWSPVDDLIVFAQPSGPGRAAADLVAIRPDGSNRRAITDIAKHGSAAVQPAFTADGQRLLFILTRAGRQETVMAVVGVDGSDLGPIGGSDYRDGFHPRIRPTP